MERNTFLDNLLKHKAGGFLSCNVKIIMDNARVLVKRNSRTLCPPLRYDLDNMESTGTFIPEELVGSDVADGAYFRLTTDEEYFSINNNTTNIHNNNDRNRNSNNNNEIQQVQQKLNVPPPESPANSRWSNSDAIEIKNGILKFSPEQQKKLLISSESPTYPQRKQSFERFDLYSCPKFIRKSSRNLRKTTRRNSDSELPIPKSLRNSSLSWEHNHNHHNHHHHHLTLPDSMKNLPYNSEKQLVGTTGTLQDIDFTKTIFASECRQQNYFFKNNQ